MPPLTCTVWPVMNRASGMQSDRMTKAASAISPSRPTMGPPLAISGDSPAVADRLPPILPGATQLTVIPRSANSSCKRFGQANQPRLARRDLRARLCADMGRHAAKVDDRAAAARPPYCAIASRLHRNAPSRMTEIGPRHSSSVISRKGFCPRIAALFTRMSTPPNSSVAATKTASTSASCGDVS